MKKLIFIYNELKKQKDKTVVEKYALRFVAGKIIKPEKIQLLNCNGDIQLTIYHTNNNIEQITLLRDNPLNYNFLCFDTLEEAVYEYNSRHIFKIKSLLNDIDTLNKELHSVENELIGEDLVSLKLSGKI